MPGTFKVSCRPVKSKYTFKHVLSVLQVYGKSLNISNRWVDAKDDYNSDHSDFYLIKNIKRFPRLV